MNLPAPQLPQPQVPAAPKPVDVTNSEPPAPAPEPAPINHSDRGHTKVSSSKMHRLWHCLYSVQDGLELPPETVSEAAETGTKFHEVVEMRINDFLNHRKTGSDPNASLQEILRNPRYTEEMVVVADAAMESIWEHGFNRSITGKAWKTEGRLVLLDNPPVAGIADFLMLWVNDKGEREAYIWDYKNGVNTVEVKNNKQLLFFCAALQEMFGKEKPFEKFRVAIYQPNSMEGGPAYKESSYTKLQVERGCAKILEIAKKVYQPELTTKGVPKKVTPKIGPGCKWCPAESICPAKKKQLRDVALLPAKSDNIVIPPVESLTDEFIAKVLAHKKQIQDFLKSVEDAATARAIEGDILPGYKLVKGKSQRRINSELDVDQAISELEALGATDCWTKKLKGVGVLEKQIGSQNLERFIKRTEPSLTLVLETDRREAVDTKANVRAVAGVKTEAASPEPETNGTNDKAKAKTKAKGAVKKKAKAKRKTIQKRKTT